MPRTLALVTLVVMSLVGADALARGQLRVVAETEFVNVGVVRDPAVVEVSGGLHDDVGQPIVGADVAMAVSTSATAMPCHAGDSVRASGGSVVVHTDALGFFCVRLPASEAVEGTELAYSGDRFHSVAKAAVPHETGRRRLLLGFESPDLSASLDAPSLIVWVSTRVVEGSNVGDPVRLVLFHQPTLDGSREVEVAATDVPIGQSAKFDVDTRGLGSPGTGKLIVRFGGTGLLAPAAETALLERHATARLSLARVPGPSDPVEGVELMVGASSVTGAVADGWVEALVHAQPVGLAPVSAGASRVVATFAGSRNKPESITLRYVPSGSGWIAGEPIRVEVAILPPSPWTGTPWLFAGAAVAYWIVRSWRRPGRTARQAPPSSHDPKASGRASIELIEADTARTGWRGRVLDAHEGTPIVGARISIVVPVFDGEGVAATQTSGPDGTFALAHVEAARNDGSRLIVTAPNHATLSDPAPRDGVLAICLVSRRRALLDRLVGWARRAGHGWAAGHREPTPLELAAVARRRRDGNVEGWAAAVAEAAYGPVPPDERREGEIVSREPPAPGSSDER